MTFPDMTYVWPEWKIEKQIGRGTFGTVWQAVRKSETITSRAAIKRISIPQDPYELEALRSDGLDLQASRTYLKRIVDDFVNEIRLMESFKGIQNIVSIEDYKVIEHNGVLGWDIYIRMELLTPFSTYLCDKTLTEAEVIDLGIDICTALEYCARRNIIHRDIKPENIFVNSFGSFKLGDFGTARQMESLTGGLSQKGTFNYMAPEVISGHSYDARVDVYSLGLVLYRLLNGNRLPFISEKQLLSPSERRNAFDRRIRGDRVPPPANASDAMASVILKACAFRPEDRFENAAQMRRALVSLSLGKEADPAPVRKVPETPPQRKKAAAPKSKPVTSIRVDAPEMVFFTPEAPKTRKRAPRKEDGISIDAPEMVLQTPGKENNVASVPGKNPWIRTFIAAALILALFIGSGSLIYFYRTTPVSLELTALPDKTEYIPGEKLNTDGLLLTVTRRDGTREVISEGFSCDASYLMEEGIRQVNVRYRGKDTEFHVAVGQVPELAIGSLPDKTIYTPGERLDLTGMTLLYWQDGRFETITEGFSCWPMTVGELGDTQITVFYQDLSAVFTVSVPAVERISVSRPPDTTSFLVDSQLDTTGMVLELHYSDGSTKTVTRGFSCQPKQLRQEGIETVTVSYQGLATTFPVAVCTVVDLQVQTLPDQTAYTVGERINTKGLVLMAKYSDGTFHQVTKGYSYKPQLTYTEGTKVVNLTYKGQSASYKIQVNADPEDTVENFTFTGLVATTVPLYYRELDYGVNENDAEVYWVLTTMFDMTPTIHKAVTPTFEASWTGQVRRSMDYTESFHMAAEGAGTFYSVGYSPPVHNSVSGIYYTDFMLPDDPGLEGEQSVTLYVGEKSVTITFDLRYLGDYETGLGWEASNVRYS